MPGVGPARVRAAGRGRGTAAFTIEAGSGLVPEAPRERPLGTNRRCSKHRSSRNPSSARPDPPTAPPRCFAPGLRRVQATFHKRRQLATGDPRAGAAGATGTAARLLQRLREQRGLRSGPRSPVPRGSGHTGAMSARRRGQGLSVPPQPGGQRPAFPGPLTCCWIFPSSVTTQWVVAAAGRVPEASSEHRPRAQPEKIHTRPSPPRPDAPAAAIFPNPGLLAPPGSGTAAAAILGAGGAARWGRCRRRGGGGSGPVPEAVLETPSGSRSVPEQPRGGLGPAQRRGRGPGAPPQHRLPRAGSRLRPTAPSRTCGSRR